MDEALKIKLNSFDPEQRAAGIAEVRKIYSAFNMHCHSFYSYNGYGYSPSMLAALAKENNWRSAMLVDFDVLDGVDEFLGAAQAVGIRAAAGMETRVFVPELADVEINSPGEKAFADNLRAKANARPRTLVEKVNAVLPEIALNFDAVAKEFTPGGNVTERHVCTAYRMAAEKKFSGTELAAYWSEKIGGFDANPVKLEALIRSKTMKRGGAGYVAPTPESFPTLEEMNRFIINCGAAPTLAWLNGLSAGENDVDRLFELHLKYGLKAATLIPDRNWRADSPEKQAALIAELDRFVAAAVKYDVPLLAGTEMNAPGQLIADDFTIPALIKHLDVFIAGADKFAK